MEELDIPLSNVIPKTLLECINVVDKEESTASWKLTRNAKDFSLVIQTFATKNVIPLKDGQTDFFVSKEVTRILSIASH